MNGVLQEILNFTGNCFLKRVSVENLTSILVHLKDIENCTVKLR
jgi:hypothetical protein